MPSTSGLNRKWLLLAAIVLIAVSVRVSYLYEYSTRPEWSTLSVDNNYHHHLAMSIAEGNVVGDTTYFRAPFYVWCLGFLYWLFGTSLWIARLFGVTIGLLTIGVAYKLTARLFRPQEGLLAAALAALCPVLVFYEGELLHESLFVLTVLISLYRAIIWEQTRTNRDLLLLGLTLGLSAITRPAILAAVPVVFVWIWIRRVGWRELAIQSVILLCGLAALILPVTVRNIVVASDPVLIASQGGINWYIGNNAEADGASAVMPEPYGFNWRISDITYAAEKARGRVLRPGEVSDYWYEQGNTWIQGHPADFLKLYARKLSLILTPDEMPNNRDPRLTLSSYALFRYNPLQFGVIAAFGLAGIFLLWKKHPAIRLPVLMMAALVIGTALYFMNGRFRLPIVPLLLATGSWFAVYLATLPALAHRARITAIFLLFGSWAILQTIHLPESDKPDVYLPTSRGLHAYANNDWQTAVEQFQRARSIDSMFPEVNLNLGVTFLRLGQLDSARHYLSEEIARHPLRTKGYSNLATIALLSGNGTEAKANIEQALKLRPYDIVANRLAIRAALADSLLPNDSLIAIVNAAAARSRQYLAVLNEAAAALISRELPIEAERFLRRATEAVPPPIETDDAALDFAFPHGRQAFAREKAKSYHLLAGLAASRNDLPAVIANEQLALACDSNLTPAYINLVVALRATGNATEAERIERIAENYPPITGQ